MKLCEYAPADEKDCLAIFDGNTPFSFAVQERETFQGFLHGLASPYSYFVVRDAAERILACGGIKLEPGNHLAKLRWDMVAKESQHQKIGTFLALSRLCLICQSPAIHQVSLYTSQHSYRFYEKLGFIVQHMVPDGIVPGMDEYFMELSLGKGKRQELERFASGL